MSSQKNCLLLLTILTLSGCSTKSGYVWQGACDSKCAQILGIEELNAIDNDSACLTLRLSYQASKKINDDLHIYRAVALVDKMKFLQCPGYMSKNDSWKPKYSWQNRCGEECEKDLGPSLMKKNDAFSKYGCDTATDLVGQVNKYKDLSELNKLQNLATLDVYDSMNCPK